MLIEPTCKSSAAGNISAMLAHARKEAGMTQTQLAAKVNSSKSYISRIEHGKFVPSADLFLRMMRALGYNLKKTE